MENINKEFRFFDRKEQDNSEDENGFYIAHSEAILAIDEAGNITFKRNPAVCLATKSLGKFYRKSRSYYGIKHINDDHYVIIDIKPEEASEKSQSTLDSRKFKLKFGIMELERDYRNKSIRDEKEQIIAPVAYDRIYVYDNLYPILELNGHYTYFCLDKNSKNYKKQLTPLVLEAACPFNTKYEGFAECTIQGQTRFLPIDFIAAEAITADDLLTEEDVIYFIESYEKFKKISSITNNEIPTLVKRLQRI